MADYQVTDIQLFDQTTPDDFNESGEFIPAGINKTGFSANIAINDSFMIQLGTDGEFSIPRSRTAAWKNDDDQDWAHENLDADELAQRLEIPTDWDSIEPQATDIF